MSLTPAEIERYARHIVLREVGGPGQQKLKAARVLIVGAAGSAPRRSSISPPPASAPSASSTTTRCRSPTCSAR
ncbi:putative adenylyltransferase/sulfurtransferase MoeZ [Methylobrevis pamukkalensis]|uniref:Putative adenylyltransferase/sulfurtransferase MoeZ n=1 Tax=Methylobrevis pamukkalensis TaxID=1439726 RepID=A0A1E3GZK7_9HYPH|nr:putative adenylyltransferase/sulfurtransferase MoeZ [Methylobrevis pamukkalensis]